jgi:hypothetical protein
MTGIAKACSARPSVISYLLAPANLVSASGFAMALGRASSVRETARKARK